MKRRKKKLSTKIVQLFICSLLLFPFFGPVQKVEALITPPAIVWAIKKIESSIPNKIKRSNGNVNLGQFKDKNGNTPVNKSSGSFKNTKDGSWTVDKDTAGHGGRKWKLKHNGKRVASLDGNGKVIGN